MNPILVLVFEASHPSTLRHFVAWLITDGGAIDTPIVQDKDVYVELTARFSDLTDTRLVARHAEEWAANQRDLRFIGLRDASVPA